MREEVENYPENVVVNWSDLARKRNIRNTQSEVAKNGGQIAKEFMKSVEIEVNSFKRKHVGNDERVRRKNSGDKEEKSLLQHHKLSRV
jgi:hypothetical protein